jgi:transposase
VDALGLPVRILLTEGTRHDVTQAVALMEGIRAKHLIADKGYDAQLVLDQALKQDIDPISPPKKNRKEQRTYDSHLYQYRHLIENAFLKLKSWRSIATRYAKTSLSFLANVLIKSIFLWL